MPRQPEYVAYCVQWAANKLGTPYLDPIPGTTYYATDYTPERLAVMARKAACKRKRDSGYKWQWRLLGTTNLNTWEPIGLNSVGWDR